MRRTLKHSVLIFANRIRYFFKGLYFASIHPKELREYNTLKEFLSILEQQKLVFDRQKQEKDMYKTEGKIELLKYLLNEKK